MIPVARIIFGENISIGCSPAVNSSRAVCRYALTKPFRLIDSRYHGLAFILRPPHGFAGKIQTRLARCRTCRLSCVPAEYALPRA